MIMKDLVTNLILKTEVFMSKKGQDLTIRREMIKAINDITGESSLDAIYVNNTDNFNIPDVVVLPLYHKDFNLFLMDGEVTNTCPFGYTIEIHERCFTQYNAEELTAVILHDILQNVQSCTAKVRFIKAYNNAINRYKIDDVLDIFDDISNSEIAYMAYVDICARPFRVPVCQYDYVGTDEVLKTMGLGDAYDSYLDKYYDSMKHWVNPDSFNNTPEARIETETRNDYRTLRTIIKCCMDKDIRHYYTVFRNGVPLVSLNYVFGNKTTVASLGFISRKREFKRRYLPAGEDRNMTAITESFINPKNEIEVRFQIDKIIADMRYAESEAEREVILIKIKNMAIKLTKTIQKLDKEYKKNPQDENLRKRLEACQNYLDELEMLREKTVKMDIKVKRYGIWCQWPVGYEDKGPIIDNGLL